MNKSETIAKLAEAVSKMQSQIKKSEMDGENPYYNSKYSTLSAVWDSCRAPLTDNGLSIIQTAVSPPAVEDWISIETTLMHESGEWVSGIMSAKLLKFDPQTVGSCVTYLRRYSLAAICGISPDEDDDGNATIQYEKDNTDPVVVPQGVKIVEMASEKQIKAIHAIIHANQPNLNKVTFVNEILGLLGKPEELKHVSEDTVTKDMARKIFDKFKDFGWTKEAK